VIVAELFDRHKDDSSMHIMRDHIKTLLDDVGDFFSSQQLTQFIQFLDADGDGMISLRELSEKYVIVLDPTVCRSSSSSHHPLVLHPPVFPVSTAWWSHAYSWY
jgi:hypothetical protein